MTTWITDRLPTADDADPDGKVRWGPNLPGLLMHWQGVREREPWTHSSSWRPPTSDPLNS